MLYESRSFNSCFQLCDFLNTNNILPTNIITIQKNIFNNDVDLLYCKYTEEPKPELLNLDYFTKLIFEQESKEET